MQDGPCVHANEREPGGGVSPMVVLGLETGRDLMPTTVAAVRAALKAMAGSGPSPIIS